MLQVPPILLLSRVLDLGHGLVMVRMEVAMVAVVLVVCLLQLSVVTLLINVLQEEH